MTISQTFGLVCGGPNMPADPTFGSDKEPIDQALLSTVILIIEDEVMIAWTLESHLQDMGFSNIVVVANGEEAVASAATRMPGLIVSDINLGRGLDGVSAAAAILASGLVPILFVTGYAGAETRSRIDREVPGAPMLRKPIQSADLRRAVLSVLSNGPAQ